MKIQEVDIRLVLGRLRPTSEYHWSGDGDFGHTLDVIGEWRDPKTTVPTEAEVLAEWERYLQEQVAQEQAKAEQSVSLEQSRSKAEANRVSEQDISSATTIEGLRNIILKQQALIEWLIAEQEALKK